MLPFDGSHLGSYPFQDVILSVKMLKHSKFLAHIKFLTVFGIEEALMYKYDNQSEYSIAVDNIKPLFGLRKTGTHIIKLSHSPRKVDFTKSWESSVENLSYNVVFTKVSQVYLLYKVGFKSRNILYPEFDGELQKYIVFQEAVKTSTIDIDNFFLSPTGYIQSHELSFTEHGKENRVSLTLQKLYSFSDKNNAVQAIKRFVDYKLLYNLHKQLPDNQIHLVSIIFDVLKL